jgi:hypothetical protein
MLQFEVYRLYQKTSTRLIYSIIAVLASFVSFTETVDFYCIVRLYDTSTRKFFVIKHLYSPSRSKAFNLSNYFLTLPQPLGRDCCYLDLQFFVCHPRVRMVHMGIFFGRLMNILGSVRPHLIP